MNLFFSELITPPARLPIPVDDAQAELARAVVDEIERLILWRAIVAQERRIVFDGALPPILELEPVSSIVSLTCWTPARFPQRRARGRTGNGADDTDVVVDAESYSVVSRDPVGTIIAPAPGSAWPAPRRRFGSFSLTYMAGWAVTSNSNAVPASVQLMVERAVAFRAGAGGLAALESGSLKLDFADSYKTDALPREIAGIGRAYAYRPGLFAAGL